MKHSLVDDLCRQVLSLDSDRDDLSKQVLWSIVVEITDGDMSIVV